jgi:hypothetical protein
MVWGTTSAKSPSADCIEHRVIRLGGLLSRAFDSLGVSLCARHSLGMVEPDQVIE